MSAAYPHAANLAILADTQRLAAPAAIALKLAVVLTVWSERARTRKQLALLNDHLLRDIGLDRHVALSEARRPFWQA